MKIVVVGAGALGGLLGSFFIRGGHHVAFVEKDGAIVDAVRERGLAYEGGSGEIRHPAAIDVSPPKNLLADGIFLCVRHGDVMGALDEVAGAVNDKTSILSFQDGVGAVPLVTARYGPSRAFAATTDLGATHHEPGHILHTGWGRRSSRPSQKRVSTPPRISPPRSRRPGSKRAPFRTWRALSGRERPCCAV
ncbi:MAG: 2-dehydropantoate 2-reductase [Deltaproteobacteria bacterium]|nr:2-dehydropantoate 2-reductase [Deltaproteobacteria bacterium]